MFGELGEGHPTGGVHVKVVLVLNEFLVDLIDAHPFRVISSAEKLDEIMLELAREISDMPPGILADDKHLAKMGF